MYEMAIDLSNVTIKGTSSSSNSDSELISRFRLRFDKEKYFVLKQKECAFYPACKTNVLD